MIKINLLPKTINEKAIIRNTAIAFGVLLVVIVAGGMTYGSKLRAQVVDMENQATAAEQWKAKVEGIQNQAKTMLSSVEPMKKKLDFIKAVLDYNKQYPKLYANVAQWTYEKVQLTSMVSDGTKVDMTARVKSLDDLGRYLLNMYQATDLFTEVVITSFQGLSTGQNLSVTTAPGGTPGMPGMPGGQGVPFMPPMPGGSGSLAGIGAITSGVERAPGVSNWIDFAVSCKLKTPIAAPSFGGAAAGAAGGVPGQPGGAAPMPMGPMGPGGGPAMPMPPMPGGPPR